MCEYHCKIIQDLNNIAEGADINALMNGQRTPLDAAYEFGTEETYKWGMVICRDHKEIIAYLKEHGAKRASELN